MHDSRSIAPFCVLRSTGLVPRNLDSHQRGVAQNNSVLIGIIAYLLVLINWKSRFRMNITDTEHTILYDVNSINTTHILSI